MDKHLFIISCDAMVTEDLDYASTLPNFGYALKNGALIKRVDTIYPSLTHPVHATLITGCPAGDTGVISNERFMPGDPSPAWRNDLSEVKRDTIFHAAKRKGLVTASCRWPMTARGGDVIDYLVPEIMRSDMEQAKKPEDAYRSLGTTECLMDRVSKALSIYGSGNDHPDYDEFQVFCAEDIIRKYRPNLLTCHPGFIDGERHRTGLFTDAVKDSVRVTDGWLGTLFDAARDAGIFDSTDFVLLSDHGQLAINRAICLNALLAERGCITVENGRVTSWKAYVASSGLSARVYISDPDDASLKAEVYNMLKDMERDGVWGFERVYTSDETRDMFGLYGDFSFYLESDGFTAFADDWQRPIVRSSDVADYRIAKATHGHLPFKGPQPIFIGFGPSFKKGAVLEKGNILDHAPTFAKILGLELPEAKGKCRNELLTI